MQIKKLFVALLSILIVTPTLANTPKGWPRDHIAMGTAVDGSEYAYQTLLQRPVDSIFTYAGINGSGDRGQFIAVDTKIQNILDQTRALEKQTGKTIRPVIVFYTVDGSDGVWAMQQDLDISGTKTNNLYLHYANLIRLCQLIQTYPDLQISVILNPDYLGELHKQCTANYCPIPFNQSVNVAGGLQQAISFLTQNGYITTPVTIPAAFLNPNATIADYNASVSWIMKTFAPNTTFGWQDNVWAGDQSGHLWIHAALQQPSLVTAHINSETAFLTQMNIYQNNYQPDFMVFDKWERDVFDQTLGGAGVNNGYLYNSNDWDIYMQFVHGISQYFNNMPIMLWQIPGGHLQITNDIDTRDDHASTAPDYFLGDTNLAAQLSNVKPYIANTLIANPSIYGTTSNKVTSYLSCDATHPTCWQQNRLSTIQKENVFAILWGGGSTTGVVGIEPALDDNGWLFKALTLSATHP